MTFLSPRKRQATRRPFDRVRKSTCGNCPTGCGVKAFLHADTLVDIFGDEDHPANKGSFCPKGLLSWVLLDHPERIVRCRVRDSLNQTFRDVAWPEALEFVRVRFRNLSRQHGAHNVIVHADETSPVQHTLGGAQFARAIGNRHSPERFRQAPFGPNGRIARMFGIPGAKALMNSQRDWANSRCIVLVGSDLAASDPVSLGPLVDVRDRGGSLVVIDSKTTMTALKASYFVRVQPGTEATLLAGINYLLIREGKADLEFLQEASTGFDVFRDAVSAYEPSSVAAICGIAEEDIHTLARVIGHAHPCQVMCGDWSTRGRTSDELLGLCAAMVCLRGSIGIPGGGVNVLNASPFEGDVTAPLAIESLLMREPQPPMAFLYGNPVARMAGGNEVRRRLRQIPLVVQLGGCNDETSGFAHVQLPITTWLEEAGLSAASNGRALQWRNPVVAARADCRPVLDIWADLLETCGLPPLTEHGQRGLTLAQTFIDQSLRNNPLTAMASVGALDPEANPPGGLLWPSVEQRDLQFEEDRFNRGDVRGPNILFRRHRKFPESGRRFPTPHGKIALDASAPGPLPVVARSPASQNRMLLVATVAVDYVNNWSGCVPTPGRPPVGHIARIHPRTADNLGVRQGETVIIENALGAFRAVADLSPSVSPNVVWCVVTPGVNAEPLGPFALFPTPADGETLSACAEVTILIPPMPRHQPEHEVVVQSGNPGVTS